MSLRTCSVFAALAVFSAGSALAGRKPVVDPIAWGVTSGNSGCVVFEEGHKYTGALGIAGKTSILRVAGTVDYSLTPSEWLETRENMDALKALAERDRVKLIKIPEKHTQNLLRRARALCRTGI